MGHPKGFLTVDRETAKERPPTERIRDFDEHPLPLAEDKLRSQASRCMDCGVPFCMAGCPLGNVIPNFNDLVYQGNWMDAIRTLNATNNFPEFTGRICPAPCESSCVLGINHPAVTIKQVEQMISDKAWEMDLHRPPPFEKSSGKSVAIVGSGPAGLACAQQLCHAGHQVVVYERMPRAGGLLAYGIPHYKLPKHLVEQRVLRLVEEGVEFILGKEIGKDISFETLEQDHDAVVLALGAEKPRDLSVPGREGEGVHFAMDFLGSQNARLMKVPSPKKPILAQNQVVVVLGGGDTGADCIGTSLRQKAKKVINIELGPRPPDHRAKKNPWPQYQRTFKPSSSYVENETQGGETLYSMRTEEIIRTNGQVTGVKVQPLDPLGQADGTPLQINCDLVLLAMGYLGVDNRLLPSHWQLSLTKKGGIATDPTTKTGRDKVFATGDCRRGQSLVVWAIAEGRETAHQVDSFLKGRPSLLPRVRLQAYDFGEERH